MKHTYNAPLFALIIALLIPSTSYSHPLVTYFHHKNKHPKAPISTLKDNLSYTELLQLLHEQREHALQEKLEKKEKTSWLDIGIRGALAALGGYLLYTNRSELAVAFFGGAVFLDQKVVIGPFTCMGQQVTLPRSSNGADPEVIVAQVQVAQQSGLSCGAHTAKNILKVLECLKDMNQNTENIEDLLHKALSTTKLTLYSEKDKSDIEVDMNDGKFRNISEDEVKDILDQGIRRLFPDIVAPRVKGHLPQLENSDIPLVSSEIPNIFHSKKESTQERAADYAGFYRRPAPIAIPLGTVRSYIINTQYAPSEVPKTQDDTPQLSEVVDTLSTPPKPANPEYCANPAHWLACVEVDITNENKKIILLMDSMNFRRIGAGNSDMVKKLLELHHGLEVGDALEKDF